MDGRLRRDLFGGDIWHGWLHGYRVTVSPHPRPEVKTWLAYVNNVGEKPFRIAARLEGASLHDAAAKAREWIETHPKRPRGD